LERVKIDRWPCNEGTRENSTVSNHGAKRFTGKLSRGKKIIYIDYFSDAEGNESDGLPASEITLNFEEYEGKTKVVSRAQFGSAEALKTVIDMGMEQGITETWDRLAEHLQSLQ
jgi:uncharacterized protein YndB with AHSA1/START domain